MIEEVEEIEKEMSLAPDKTMSTTVLIGWLVCALGALFYCYEYFLRIEPSIMVPQLMRSFDVHAGTFGFIISMYYFIYTPMQAGVGVLTDVFGPRKILTIAVAVCALGSYLFGGAHSVYLAGLGRALIGFGSAFAFVGVLKLAAVWLPANRFALFVGIAVSLGMVGAMFGDMELAYMVHHVGWRKTIYVGTIFGIFLIPVIWLVVRDRPKKQIAGVKVIPQLTAKETMRGFFVNVRNPQMWIAGFIGASMYLSLSVFAELWGDQFLIHTYHFSNNEAAFANSMVFLGWLAGAPIIGLLSDQLRMRRLPLTLGCIAATIIVSVILFLPEIPVTIIYFLLVLFGIACSAQIICFAVGRENSRPGLSGTAIAFVNMLVMLGGMIFQPLVGKMLDLHWGGLIHNGIRVYTSTDYRFALTIIPVMFIVGAILSLFLHETHAKAGQG